MNEEPFEIIAYDKNLDRIGWIGDPEHLSVTPYFNQQGSLVLTLPLGHRYQRVLATPGVRLVVYYQEEFLMSGPCRLVQSSGAGAERKYTYTILDDFRVLSGILAWPNPAGNINQQGDDGAYDVRSGPAETVFKDYVLANLVNRIGSGSHHLPVEVEPTQGRGSNISVQMRMHPLTDRLLPLVDQAGVGVRVRQVDSGLRVECYEPRDWSILLSEDAGTLIAADYSLQTPEVTRVVVLASGQGEDRIMRGPFIDTQAEADYRIVIEEAVDARDLDPTAPDFEDTITQRAQLRLAEGAAKAGLSLTLEESEVFQYGGPDGVRVGDRVVVELEPPTDENDAVTHTDILRSCSLQWSGDDGVRVVPRVGDRSDDPNLALIRTVARLMRRQREQITGD